jgi:hypothetical protein
VTYTATSVLTVSCCNAMAVRKMNFHKIKMKRFQIGIGSVYLCVCCCVCAVSNFFENCHHDDHTRLPQTISDLNIIWYKIPDLQSEYQLPIRMVLFALSAPTVVEIRYCIASKNSKYRRYKRSAD